MSEQKMRDALITAREVLALEGYAEDNLAVVKIDEALAQPSALSEQMREALELADAALSGANMNMNVVERKVKAALAQQPAALVELKEYELQDLWMYRRPFDGDILVQVTAYARAVIAAHEAKKNGGGV